MAVFRFWMGRWWKTSCLTFLLSSVAVAQQGSISDDHATLAMPAHPERRPEAPEATRPKESQPNREDRPSVFVQSRTGSNMPMPGRPSRGLPPLEELAEEELAPEEAEEAAEEAGLISRLPHQLRDGGITIEYIYTGETFTKARGGITPGRPTNYRSNFDLVGTVDTAKMGWWESGRFLVYGQNLSGRPLSQTEVGDVQLFSNLDSTISDTERPHFTTVAEYWYEHLLFDDLVRIKIGKQDANADFAFTDLGGDFVHSSFGVPPMIPLPTFPSQALGVASFLKLTDELVFGFGAFDGTLPSGPQGLRWGFDTLGHNGSVTLYQLEWKPTFGELQRFPSTVRVGMWHHSDKEVWSELTAGQNPRTFNQNYGVFHSFDQLLWKESEAADDDQGLGMFGQFGWAPGNRNTLQEYYGGGFVYKGFVPGRDDDLIGVGFANVLFGSGFRAQSAAQGDNVGTHETAVETFYKCQLSPYFSVQPDVQFIANPSGLYRDALVPGMRFEVVL